MGASHVPPVVSYTTLSATSGPLVSALTQGKYRQLLPNKVSPPIRVYAILQALLSFELSPPSFMSDLDACQALSFSPSLPRALLPAACMARLPALLQVLG